MTIDQLEYEGIRVVLHKLPGTVRGFVVKDGDGGYCIVINEDLSPDGQKETIRHELQHIKKGECDQDDYVEYSAI